MNELTIFYSWQSDLPNSTNRGLIEEALKKALKNLNKDETIKVVPRIDKDTAGVPGSPNIATTILEKVDRAFLVVSDLTIINSDSALRKTPNPNVLYELGYAVKSLGHNNVILVQNTAFGPPSDLPFDLKMQRVITYSCTEEDKKSELRDELVAKFELAIREALVDKKEEEAEKTEKERFEELLLSNPSPLKLEKELQTIVKQTLSSLKATEIYNYSTYPNQDEYLKRKAEVEKITQSLCNVFFILGRWVDNTQIEIVMSELMKFVTIPDSAGTYYPAMKELAKYPALLFTYALGLGATYNTNNVVLKGIFSSTVYDKYTGKNRPLISFVNTSDVLGKYKEVVKEEKRYFPGSDELFSLFRTLFDGHSEEIYEDFFDSWEYFISLYYCYWRSEAGVSMWVPTGSYIWRNRRRKIWEEIFHSFSAGPSKWKFLHAFDMTEKKLSETFTMVNEFIEENMGYYH